VEKDLMMFRSYEELFDNPHFDPTQVATITQDGTITALPVDYNHYGFNIFDEFNGYTLEQIEEFKQQAKTWHETYT